MASIYKGAEQVIIWLGLESRFVEVAFKLAARIRPVLRELGVRRGISNPELQERGLPSYRGKEFEALGAVIQLPWFSRAWVVQELWPNLLSFILDPPVCLGLNSLWS